MYKTASITYHEQATSVETPWLTVIGMYQLYKYKKSNCNSFSISQKFLTWARPVMPANMWHQHIIHKPHQFSSCLAAVPIAPKVRKWVSYSIVKLNYRITNPLSDTANTVKYCDEYVGLSVCPHAYLDKYSISANAAECADVPRDAASRKIDHIALPTKYNYQATSGSR